MWCCEVNKQLNDKERVAAALENPVLLDTVEQTLADAGKRGQSRDGVSIHWYDMNEGENENSVCIHILYSSVSQIITYVGLEMDCCKRGAGLALQVYVD